MTEQKRDAYYMRTENPIIKNFLSKQENKSEAMEKILEDVLTGELVPKGEVPKTTTRKEELELEYKYLRNKKISIDIQLKERELTYWETFEKPPTPQATLAMKNGLQMQREEHKPTHDKIKKAYEYMTNQLSSGKVSCNECNYVTISKVDLHLHFDLNHTRQLEAVIREMPE